LINKTPYKKRNQRKIKIHANYAYIIIETHFGNYTLKTILINNIQKSLSQLMYPNIVGIIMVRKQY